MTSIPSPLFWMWQIPDFLREIDRVKEALQTDEIKDFRLWLAERWGVNLNREEMKDGIRIKSCTKRIS
jgi:hypothetical protein